MSNRVILGQTSYKIRNNDVVWRKPCDNAEVAQCRHEKTRQKVPSKGPVQTYMKKFHRDTFQLLAILFSDLCMVVNIAVDMRVPGQIILGGRTRYPLVNPAKA